MKKIVKSLFRKKRKNENWLRYLMYILHLWLGILSSVVIFTVCISGSIYAFKTQIIEAYNSDKVFIKIENQKQNLIEFENQLKNEGKTLTSITIPESENRSWNISYLTSNGKSVGTYYNPFLKKELGNSDEKLDSFFSWILDLHRNLLMGNVGRQINGACVLMFLALMISGFILWLPKKIKYLKQKLSVKLNAGFKRINLDLHNAIGFYTMLFLAFISVTGLYITYPWVKNAIIVSLGGEALSEIKSSEKSEDSFSVLMGDMMNREQEKNDTSLEMSSLNNIVDKTNKTLPSKGTIHIDFPNNENPRFMVKKISNNNILRIIITDELTFDKSGELKTKEFFTDKPLNQQFTSLAKPLHTGEILGLPSIIFYFIITLLGASLPVTGLIIWYHRLQKM